MSSKKVVLIKEEEEEKVNDRSVFVVLNFYEGICRGVLYEFKIKQGGQIVNGGVVVKEEEKEKGKPPFPLLHPIAHFFEDGDPDVLNFLSCAKFCGSSELYLLLGQGLGYNQELRTLEPVSHSLDGQIFDMKTRSSSPASFKRPPKYYKRGPLISAYGKLYYLADPSSLPNVPEISFQRYDPSDDSWKTLPSAPCSFYSDDWRFMETVGYAVCRGCILFLLASELTGRYEFMAFHVHRTEWYQVKETVRWYDHFPFRGRAVVVGGDDDTSSTIYAASNSFAEMVILSFSFWEEVDPSGLSYSYFIGSPIQLSGLRIVSPPSPPPFSKNGSYYLVHLGDLEFCLVQTGYNYFIKYGQHLCITTFRIVLEEGSSNHIKVLDSSVHELCLPIRKDSYLLFSCTLDFDDSRTQEDERPSTVKVRNTKGAHASNVVNNHPHS